MNKAILLGRITKDPELRFAAGSGTAVSRFTIAINRPKRKDQEKAETDFINCVAFGKRAETISQYFQKGGQIAVSGRIQTGSGYDDSYFHKKVIPEMTCDKCGKKADANYRPLATKYPDGFQI